MNQHNQSESNGKMFSIKWCGGAYALSDTHFAFIKSEDALAKSSHCDECDLQVPVRTMMCDGDIMEVACLCGYRHYSCTDVYTDRDWTTEYITRLFGVNRLGEPQMHVFKATDGSPSLREQVNAFCRANRTQLPVMMPMDPLPGVEMGLVEQARSMARAAYMTLDGEFHIAHHFKARYLCL